MRPFTGASSSLIDPQLPGRIVEIGSGIGNLKAHVPGAICTDLFANPWLDLVCDGYELPFAEGSLSHLVLFDVFHHLRAPNAFLREARRVLAPGGRLILFEPYISWASLPVYGLLHHEPVAWKAADQPGGHAAASARLLRRAGQCDAAVLPARNSRLAGGLGNFSRAGVQQFQLPALRRIQQTGAVSGGVFGIRATLR